VAVDREGNLLGAGDAFHGHFDPAHNAAVSGLDIHAIGNGDDLGRARRRRVDLDTYGIAEGAAFAMEVHGRRTGRGALGQADVQLAAAGFADGRKIGTARAGMGKGDLQVAQVAGARKLVDP